MPENKTTDLDDLIGGPIKEDDTQKIVQWTPQEGALDFAGRGYFVLPTRRNMQSRKTLTATWDDASNDPAVIREWASKWPKANYAVHLERSGLVCLDLDDKHKNQDAEAALLRLQEAGKCPETLIVRTRSGGYHVYFNRPEGDLSNLQELPGFPGIEFKANAIMTIAGSFYANGAEYRVVTNGTIADCPGFDLHPVKVSSYSGLSVQPTGGPIVPGQRNTTLTSLAGSMRRRGMSAEAILAALLVENRKCDPPLPDSEIQAIAVSVGSYTPTSDADILAPNLTDVGNAERLHMLYGDVARWVYPWDQAVVWTGKRWEKDGRGLLHAMAHAVVKRLYMAAFTMEDRDEAVKVSKKALSFESSSRIAAMIHEAGPRMAVGVDELDVDPMLFNCANGTVNLVTGKLQAPDPADMITKLSPVPLDPDAECPRWDSFLLEVMNDDTEMVAFLQRSVGLALTGDSTEDHFWFLYGSGRIGKTVFLETVHALLGDYAQSTRIETVLLSRTDQVPNDIAALAGARFVSATEASKSRQFDVGRIKMLTGGDTVRGRFLYQEEFDFKPQLKLWIAANNQPGINEQTRAIWERLLLVPFTQVFTGSKADKQLEQKLLKEAPGILQWAIRGCRHWLEDGLGIPGPVKDATETYRLDEDALEEFVASRLQADPDGWVLSHALYEQYLFHCETTGIKRPWSHIRFSKEMAERGYRKERTRAGAVWYGIKVG